MNAFYYYDDGDDDAYVDDVHAYFNDAFDLYYGFFLINDRIYV